MPPPTADTFASRIFLGPALRAQSDRRLVALVRDGYELAFEEIVRRYGAPLERFAAAIVGSHSEDVTQDAFSKALLALRGSEAEIELRPWLYRIVRNTALNDIRDGPPATEELGETMAGGVSAAAEAERREEMSELTERLRALPETQRAAIVMRELEGLSHEEIAAAWESAAAPPGRRSTAPAPPCATASACFCPCPCCDCCSTTAARRRSPGRRVPRAARRRPSPASAPPVRPK